MSKILVVGGAGYIGGGLVDMLTDGYVSKSFNKVIVYDSLVYQEDYRKDVEFVYGDVRDREKLLKYLKWADCIIWLAALVGDGACAINPDLSREINQESVKWMAENFKGRIIYLSTCSVYGANDVVLDETSPAHPLSVYAETKLASEKYLEGKNAISFRLGTLFGISDLFSRIRFDLVVNTLVMRAHRVGKVQVFGGDQWRPLLHVRDVAKTVVENIDTRHTGIFNLCKQNVKISDLAHQVRCHFPDLKIETTEMKFEDLRNYRVSAQKAVDVLGFKPVHTLDEGIEEVKKLLDDHRICDLDNPRYSNAVYLKKNGAK